MPEGAAREPLTAIEVLRRFNCPNGVAHTMAGMVADQVVSEAGRDSRKELVDRFAVHGDLALQRLRQAPAAPETLTVLDGIGMSITGYASAITRDVGTGIIAQTAPTRADDGSHTVDR